MKFGLLIRGACLSSLIVTPVLASVSPEEAKQLGGPTLTGFGAERAGNADGSIPAYTVPLSAPPPGLGVDSHTLFLPDPYAGEKMLYRVDASNLSRYASLVTPGIAAMIRKYPTFHLDVYPTHRSVGYPQWVLDNTKKDATTAHLVGDVEGDGVAGAYGSIPFPIPKNGYEVLWNYFLHWEGPAAIGINGGGYFVDANGNATLTNRTSSITNYAYFDPTKTKLPDGFYYKTIGTTTAPAGEDGQKILIYDPINYSKNDQLYFSYTLGQRRVRLAPEFKYDTPIAPNGGAFTYDEIALFAGRPDRFDFKLMGKKELLIPYNDYAFLQPAATVARFLTPRHPNPDFIRWEKHRVWVLEATLKPGQRHIYSHRTFYVDEDSWNMAASDSYDQANKLYRVAFNMIWPVYNAPFPVAYEATAYFNLNRGSYAWSEWFGGPNNGGERYLTHLLNASQFSPESMAGSGIR